MPRNGSGIYSLPSGNPVVSGTTISSTWANNTLSDIATALTYSLTKDGQTSPTANIPMGGFRHTGVGDAVALNQYLTANQSINGVPQYLSTVSGGDTITASGSLNPTAYVAGQRFVWIAVADNTGAATINIAGIGAENLYKKSSGGPVALVAKDMISGQVYSATYDGTQFVLDSQRANSQGADIASASTVNLDTATGDYIHITGTTAITAITLQQGEERTVVFDGILDLTYGASLLLPGGSTITTAANDTATFRGEASSVVRCTQYSKSNGDSISSGAMAGIVEPFTGPLANVPSGYIAVPLSATNVSRTTYARLFAAIGTTWGAGDGSTTFALPYCPAGHTFVNYNTGLGAISVGEVIAHTHVIQGNTGAGGNLASNAGVAPNYKATDSTGGAANLAAGAKTVWILKI